MVASVKTTERLVETIMKYVPAKNREALLADLQRIPGNKSFQETIDLIERIMRDADDHGQEV